VEVAEVESVAAEAALLLIAAGILAAAIKLYTPVISSRVQEARLREAEHLALELQRLLEAAIKQGPNTTVSASLTLPDGCVLVGNSTSLKLILLKPPRYRGAVRLHEGDLTEVWVEPHGTYLAVVVRLSAGLVGEGWTLRFSSLPGLEGPCLSRAGGQVEVWARSLGGVVEAGWH